MLVRCLTSLKSSSLRCCLLRSIILTATTRPLCLSRAIHTTPVEPSPIFTKFSRYERGSPLSTTICSAALNCSWVTLGGSGGGRGEGYSGGLNAGEQVPGGLLARDPVGDGRGCEGLSCLGYSPGLGQPECLMKGSGPAGR